MSKKFLWLWYYFGVVLLNPLSAQQIRINEVVASNSSYTDEEGDTPDWIELYNYGSTPVNLHNWSISDQVDQPQKWQFPDLTIPANDFLLIWASGKDLNQSIVPRTLVSSGDDFRYLLPNSPVDADWVNLSYDDTAWNSGPTGIGYADGDDATQVPSGTLSVFLRKKFNVDHLANMEDLYLDIDYDDGFVAYLNGKEVARAQMTGVMPAYNAVAINDREAEIYQGGKPQRFYVPNPQTILQDGENVLCIQVHNVSANSSDLSLIPYLSALYTTSSTDGVVPPSILELQGSYLHTNFKISTSGETLQLFNENGIFVDELSTGNLRADVSIGVASNNELAYFDPPTPAFPNQGDGFLGVLHDEVIFSRPGGLTSTFSLQLSGAGPGQVIRYTTDATVPTANSPSYQGPIAINSSTVVRGRIFQDDFIPSPTQSASYLIGTNHQLPIVSLVTEPANFFDDDQGIYVLGNNHEPDYPFFGANFWQDWERPIHFSFYKPDNSNGFSVDGGVKIFGGWSRANGQRSMSLFARKQYGSEAMDYSFFSNRNYQSYQALVLRNAGNDWLRSNFRDGLMTGLMENSELDVQAFQPVVTYLNGDYWGLYNLREKVNEHFLAARHNVDPDDLDILETQGFVIHGDNQDYLDLIDFVEANSMQTTTNFNQVAAAIDIENFIIYNVAQIYFDNQDWPGNNNKFWREKNGKWKWILFDTDFGFGVWNPNAYSQNTLRFALEPNGPGWPNPPWSTLLFRKLMTNQSFKHQFVNRMADEMNSRFLAEGVQQKIDSLQSLIQSEVNRHHSRWGGSNAFWNEQLGTLRTFASRRASHVKSHLLTQLALPAYHQLTIEMKDPQQGKVIINNRLSLQEPKWEGDYFESVPISIEVEAAEGFYFSHWEGDLESTSPLLNVDMQNPMTLIPVFGRLFFEEGLIAINEINYQSSSTRDAGDWVELVNLTNTVLEVSNWQITNTSNNRFVLPPNSLLPAKGFLVLTNNLQKFQNSYPQVDNAIGDFDFDLSPFADTIKLYDSNKTLYDLVGFDSEAPWPSEANGGGPTLELKNPQWDNDWPGNWGILHEFGTPGSSNLIPDIVFNDGNVAELRCLPNPFVDEVVISFYLQNPSTVKAELYAANGVLVQNLIDQSLGRGYFEVKKDLGFLSKGLYFLKFSEGGTYTRTQKWLKE